MGLKEDLQNEVNKILQERWSTRDGLVVPEPENLALGNDGIFLDATVLYADLSGSTRMVDTTSPAFAAEVYKCYLSCAGKLIRYHGGTITAYDGDRVMAVFIGDNKNTNAVKCALNISSAVTDIINPSISKANPISTFRLQQVVGVDTSKLLVARIGVRGDNDLVWVGRAANYAAKLTELEPSYPLRITAAVYNRMSDTVKLSAGQSMWEERLWTAMNNIPIYRSNWRRVI